MTEGNGSGSKTLRFDAPITVSIGGEEVTLEPLKGLKALREFERALADEVQLMKGRIESALTKGGDISPEALLERGADQARLLLLGSSGAITAELLEEKATAREMLGALTVICQLNNLARFVPFFAPEVLMDLGRTMSLIRKASAGEPPQPSSSTPASAGGTSSKN
jgi:hypothetical protein